MRVTYRIESHNHRQACLCVGPSQYINQMDPNAAAAWAQYYAQQGYAQYQAYAPAAPPAYAAPAAQAPPPGQPQAWAGQGWPAPVAAAPVDPAWQYQMQPQPVPVMPAAAPVMPGMQGGPPPPPPRRPAPPAYAPPAAAPPQHPPAGQPGAPAQHSMIAQPFATAQPQAHQQPHQEQPQPQQALSPAPQQTQAPEQQYMQVQPQAQQQPTQQQYMQSPQQLQQPPEQQQAQQQQQQQAQQQQQELLMQQQLLRQQQQQLLEQQALLLQQKQQALEQQKMLFAQQQAQAMQQQWSTATDEQRQAYQQQQYMQALQEQWGGAYALLASLPEAPEDEQEAQQQAWQQQAWLEQQQQQQQQGQDELIGPQLPPGAQQAQGYAEGIQQGQEQGFYYPGNGHPETAGMYSDPAGPAGPPVVSVPLAAEAAQLAAGPAAPLLNAMDLRLLLLPPGRATRPRRVLLVLRGLPGSGKSTLARCIREVETKHSGQAPRIHSIDDYFMTEVEKELDDVPPPGAPAGARGRKRKAVETEYQYDAAMEGAYAKSLVKAVGRTLEEAGFSLVVVDAPCARAEQVRELWAMGQHAGYEAFAVVPLETNPEVCHQRNTHGRKLDELLAAASAFEALPPALPVTDASQLMAEWWLTRDVDGADDAHKAATEGGLGAVPVPAAAVAAAVAGAPSAGHADAEGAGAASASRWGGLEEGADGDADAARGPASKKARRGDDRGDADAAEALQQSDVGGGVGGRSSTGGKASALKKASDGSVAGLSSVERRRVRWPDQEEAQPEEGFRIAAPLRQLEEVFVVAGLGPNGDQNADTKAASVQKKSFSQAVRAEHLSEHDAFRALLLGKGTAGGAGSSRGAAVAAD